jgi:hypothetical protein
VPSKDSSPECALALQVGRIEHDHLTYHVHDMDASTAQSGMSIAGVGSENQFSTLGDLCGGRTFLDGFRPDR